MAKAFAHQIINDMASQHRELFEKQQAYQHQINALMIKIATPGDRITSLSNL